MVSGGEGVTQSPYLILNEDGGVVCSPFPQVSAADWCWPWKAPASGTGDVPRVACMHACISCTASVSDISQQAHS